MIKIRQPLGFSEIGKRDNQEDYLYPPHSDIHTRVFILCDGMGGHDNGEVASMTAATALGDYLSQFKEIDKATFEKGLAKAYDVLDEIDPRTRSKPGTTMTCLCLNRSTYLVAHIGDSRIYHIRPSLFNPATGQGGILYQSSDHSLVNDLLKAGEISEEEARDFPQKNVITRAMQPHLERRYKADIFQFNDIASGDYFFLCSDGVLECLSNEELCRILSDTSLSDTEKINAIKDICATGTRDNHSGWLIPIEEVDNDENTDLSHTTMSIEDTTASKSNPDTPKQGISNNDSSINYQSATDPEAAPKKGTSFSSLFMLLLAILGVFLVGILWYFL